MEKHLLIGNDIFYKTPFRITSRVPIIPLENSRQGEIHIAHYQIFTRIIAPNENIASIII